MLVDTLFLRHPRTQGEGYLQHARIAGEVGGGMVLGGLACFVHAVLPCAVGEARRARAPPAGSLRITTS